MAVVAPVSECLPCTGTMKYQGSCIIRIVRILNQRPWATVIRISEAEELAQVSSRVHHDVSRKCSLPSQFGEPSKTPTIHGINWLS